MNYDCFIGTVRFTDKTYIENTKWKERKHFTGCAYGLDKPIAKHIPIGKIIYVLEMNNTQNKIMAIGKITNNTKPQNRSRMYKEERYNKYIYKGNDYIHRNCIINTKSKGDTILKLLETIVFKGKKHFKRGQGCIILRWNRISTIEKNKVKRDKSNPNKCALCGKPIKGHICSHIKKNEKLEKIIYKWFKCLFN
jgi:hypothetical protein